MVSQQSYVSIAPGQSINVYPYGGATASPVAASVNPNATSVNAPPPPAANSSGGPPTMVSAATGTPTAAGGYSYGVSQHQVRENTCFISIYIHTTGCLTVSVPTLFAYNSVMC